MLKTELGERIAGSFECRGGFKRRSHGGPAMASHLTLEERQFLYRLKKRRKSNAEIAELMGRHRSTIGREVARNTGGRGYRPRQAQRLADERRLASRRPHKMDDPDVHQYVQDRLEEYWSPDQIAGRAQSDFPRAPALVVEANHLRLDSRSSARVAGPVASRWSASGKTGETDRLCPHRRATGSDQRATTVR